MKKNVGSQVVGAQMLTAADGTAFTGEVTVYVTGDGGAQVIGQGNGSPNGIAVHEGNGFHSYVPTQAETNFDHVAFTFIGTGAVPVTVQCYPGFPQTGDSYARIGAPAGASVSADVAAVKSDSAAILVDTAEIGAAGAGLTALATAAALATVDGNVDAILADTADMQPKIGTPAGASVSADVAAVKAQTAAIETDTQDVQARLPAALTAGGNMKSDALALNGDATAAANIAKTTRAIARGTADTGGTTTSIPTSAFSPAGAAADQFKGRIVTFDADTTTAALRGQSTDITASSNSATPTLTVTALTTAPAAGDTFSVT